jgi:hypothetical protein
MTKSRLAVCILGGLACLFTLTLRAQQRAAPIQVPMPTRIQPLGIPAFNLEDPPNDTGNFVNFVGVIPIPGNPVASTDIVWADQGRGRVYLTDRSNLGIDIFDAVANVYVGRIPGFVGPAGVVGTGGPNGVVVTPDNHLWAGDGNGLVQVADLNVDPPAIIKTISTGPVSNGRADELGYDPLEHIILIATPGANPRYATFISADSYNVLGQVQFPDATGLEQPTWDNQLHRFLLTVPAGTTSYVAVIDPVKMTVTNKFPLGNCAATGLVLGPFQLLMTSCGFPIILNAIDGHIIQTITQVHGGDEIWYSNGDGRLYVTSTDSAGQQSLGVIDLQSSTWLQNIPVNRGKNPAAFEPNNQIFVTVTAPPAGTADTTVCATYGLSGRGCMAVYHHY